MNNCLTLTTLLNIERILINQADVIISLALYAIQCTKMLQRAAVAELQLGPFSPPPSLKSSTIVKLLLLF